MQINPKPEKPSDVDAIHMPLLSADDQNSQLRPPGQELHCITDLDSVKDDFDRKMVNCPRYRVNSTVFFDWLQRLAQVPSNSSNRKRFYFRGESRARFQLLPSLLRDGVYEGLRTSHGAKSPIDLQQKLLDRYRRYTQHLIHSDNDFKAPIWDDFDTLCLAQHHGLPTLLMDWTLNPYVASYFALSGAFRTAVREELSAHPKITKYWARVWVMRLKPPADRQRHTVHLENRKGGWDKMLGEITLTPTAPFIVVPLVFTRRIAAQVGRFVYCGHIARDIHNGDPVAPQTLCSYSENSESELCWDQLYSLDIEFDISKTCGQNQDQHRKLECFRKDILTTMAHLEFTGFHAGRLFPDLEGWARYLAEGNL